MRNLVISDYRRYQSVPRSYIPSTTIVCRVMAHFAAQGSTSSINIYNSDDSDTDHQRSSRHETSSLLQRQSSGPSEIRKCVKSVDQTNFHEEAVESCKGKCPDICFQTFYGIHFHPLNFCLMSLWISGVLFFVIMVGGELETKWNSINKESSTSVSYHHTHHLDFPAITICNMAKNIPLTPVRCSSFDSARECPEYNIPINILDPRQESLASAGAETGSEQSSKIEKAFNLTEQTIIQSFNLTNDKEKEKARASNLNTLRHCLSFNNNKMQQYSTKRPGLTDALTVVLRVNIDQYPKHAKYSGVHIDLHAQCSRELGECPEELDSTLVAAPGSPRFFRMTKHHHRYLNGTMTEYYEAKDSASGDYNFENHFGSVKDTVVVTFLYADMSLMEATEMPRYTWFSLLAEVGGLMGLLFGVGIINIITVVIKATILGKKYINSATML